MNAVTLTVPLVPPPMNGPKGILRMHWAKRQRVQAEWCEWLTAGMNEAEHNGQGRLVREIRRRVLAGERNRVEIEIYHSRKDDHDNLYGRAKLILDAMKYKKGAGIIWDDDEKHLELVVRQVKCRRDAVRTVIRIAADDPLL